MLSKKVLVIIKRELKSNLLTKKFLLMTFLLPLFIFGLLGIQTFLVGFGDKTQLNLEVIAETEPMRAMLASQTDDAFRDSDTGVRLDFKTLSPSAFESYLEERKPDLLEGRLTGIYYVPRDAVSEKRVVYYSNSPKNLAAQQQVEGFFNRAFISTFLSGKNLSDSELSYIRNGITTSTFKVSKEKTVSEEGFGNLILAYIFAFLLYMSLLLSGSMVMQAVIDEKGNKVFEVMLSSCSPVDLMAGKILAWAVTALFQMLIWLTPVFFLMVNQGIALPAFLSFSLAPGQIAYLLLYFAMGLIIFLGMYASAGSLFETPQEAQSAVFPIMLLILIPFFLALTLVQNPQNSLAQIASVLPFAGIFVMPVRTALIDVPLLQILSSLALNLLTLCAVLIISGRIYRTGILRTGKKPSLKEIAAWVRG